MQNNETLTNQSLNGEKYKIAIIRSKFNNEVTKGLLDGALKALKECKVKEKNIFVLEVPGTFEIPISAKRIAETGKYDAIVCVGAVIKGETRHDEYIAHAASKGMIDVALKYNLPVSLGVITALNLEQAQNRSKDDHNNRGYEAAISTVDLLENLKSV